MIIGGVKLISIKLNSMQFFGFILLCGVVSLGECVTYQLSVLPVKVGPGDSLAFVVHLLSPTKADTGLKLMLSKPSQTDPLTVFVNKPSCSFGQLPPDNADIDVYSRTGTIVMCDTTNSRYVIRFDQVQAEHFGTYYIVAQEEDPPVSLQAGIQVQVKSSVAITPSILEVMEGREARLECTVDDEIPLPVIFAWRVYTWDRNIVNLSPSIQQETSGRSYTLTWTSVSREDMALYQCTARNAQGSVPSEWATVSVYYAAETVTLTANTTTVTVGETVMFTCTSTSGHPNPGLVIYDTASDEKLKEISESWDGSRKTLTLQRVMQKSDYGASYGCRTKTSVYIDGLRIPVKESNLVTFTVKFPPSNMNVPSTVTVDEGQSVTVRCETSSSNPRTELTWSGTGSDQAVQSTSPGDHGGVKTALDLTLTGYRSRNAGLIMCTATYLGKQLFTKSTEIHVNFAPQGVTLSGGTDTLVIENQEIVMRCQAGSSNPVGTIVWTKRLNGVESVAPEGTFSQVPGDFGGRVLETEITLKPTRQDNGTEYWCEAEFTYTNGTKVSEKSGKTSLLVYYPANVRIDMMGSDPVILTCISTGGNPTTIDQYSWSFDNEVLAGASERSLSVQRDQSGNYSCSVTNKGGTSSSRQVTVAVKYKPTLDPTAEHHLELSTALEENVTFSVSITANPQPTAVEWSKIRDNLPLGPRFRADNRNHVYSLHVSNIRPEDFTTYACKVTNSVGTATFFVTLKPRGPPDTPSNFAVITRTTTSLTLGWKSRFPGAANQTFLLELLVAEPRVFVVVDPGVGSAVTYVVSDLEPDTEYRFRLRAENNLGLLSPYTDTVRARTEPDMMTDLQVTIAQVNEITVLIKWLGQDGLFSEYPDVTVKVQYILANKAERQVFSALKNSTTVRFADKETRISVLKGFTYTFNIIVYEGDTVIFQLFNLSTETVSDDESKWIIIAAVSAGIVIIVSIVGFCLHRRLRKRRDSEAPETIQAPALENGATSTQAFRNLAFGESGTVADSPYHIHKDHTYAVVGIPEDDVTYIDHNDTVYAYADVRRPIAVADEYSAPEDENGYLEPVRRELPRPPSLSESDIIEIQRHYLTGRAT